MIPSRRVLTLTCQQRADRTEAWQNARASGSGGFDLIDTLHFVRRALCAAAVFSSAAMLAQKPAPWLDPANWANVTPPVTTRDVVYFPRSVTGYLPSSQRLDVYQNAGVAAGKKAPVLLYIHGGAWRRGDKPATWHGFRAWLAAGFSVVTMQYRMADDTPPAYAPAAVQDVFCALSWIRKNAGQYGFDASDVVTYGTSAGGHLALLTAVLPEDNDINLPACREQPHIAAVLDFYGPYHLNPQVPGAFQSPSVKKWMGPDPQPSLEAKERALSPSTYIRKGIPPVFQAHGDADPTVPYQSSIELQRDLDHVGVKNTLDTVPGGLHGKWTPEENQRVQLDSLKFLQSVGAVKTDR